jgi:pimeloyl-ACP methyl ester carboxylesterase
MGADVDRISAKALMKGQPRYRTATVEGLEIFSREACDPSQPTLVLLHGFPASSFMFRELITALADGYHLVAPDHVGFGHSAMPTVDEFDYTFERLSEITFAFLDRMGLDRFALYVQDYGAPIGLRIASRNPARVTALISQNGNAYTEGFTPFWDGLFAYARDGVTNAEAARASMDPEGTRWVYTHGVPAGRLELLAPDARVVDQAALDRPGYREVQLALFRDYPSNIDEYPAFQWYFRAHQPPALVAWGEKDEIFGPEGARAHARDLPDAEIHLLDAGHYALETGGDEIAALVRPSSTGSSSDAERRMMAPSHVPASLPPSLVLLLALAAGQPSPAPSTPSHWLMPSRPASASPRARRASWSRPHRAAMPSVWSCSSRSGTSSIGGI